MRRAWRFVVRLVFWSYERGSLPYDLMVIAILAFVLLTPRKWYNDQPAVGLRPTAGQIQLLNVDPATSTELFRVDASLLTPPRRTPELEQETHALLSRSVESLHGQLFQIVQIQPVRAADGSVVGYDVRIKPSR
jgi:hypothetical protein